MLIAGNDDSGLELAARLFPLRTGVPVSRHHCTERGCLLKCCQIPDWAVVGPRMSWQGAGGLIGAG